MRQDTICVQGGWKPKKGEPRVLPIYQSTTFKYDTTEEMGRLFALEDNGYFYTRLQNPTNDCVAAKIAELEGGAACPPPPAERAEGQVSLTAIGEAEVLARLRRSQPDALTPIEALGLLYELKQKLS